MKIAVIGAGKIGSTLAYTLLERGLNEITLLDVRTDYLEGVRMDLQSAFPFARIKTEGMLEDYDIIVMTAGFPRTPDMKNRDELFAANKKVIIDVFSGKEFTRKTKIIVVTNPADKITQYVIELTKLPKESVIEFGNQLDSNRLKYLTQEHDAYVTGGHNEDMKLHCKTKSMDAKLKNFASEIIKKSGGTIFGPAKALADLIDSLH
jgi:malate dehydrogenase